MHISNGFMGHISDGFRELFRELFGKILVFLLASSRGSGIAGWDGPTDGTGLLQQGKQFKQVDGGSIDTGSVDAFETVNSII